MHFAIAYGTLLVSCSTAFLLGGKPERLTALACLTAVILTRLAKVGGDFVDFQTGILLVDLALLMSFVALALASDRFWPIPVCALQAITVGGHILRLVAQDQRPLIYETMVTAPYYPIMALLMWASLRAWARQRNSAQPRNLRIFFPPFA